MDVVGNLFVYIATYYLQKTLPISIFSYMPYHHQDAHAIAHRLDKGILISSLMIGEPYKGANRMTLNMTWELELLVVDDDTYIANEIVHKYINII